MFLVAVISYSSLLTVHVAELNVMSHKYVEYNNNVDTAVDAAVAEEVESAVSSHNLQVNFEGCVDNFYNSLYASFGALDNEILQQDLMLYTPVIALADVDGFYVMYNTTNNYGELVKTKTQKIPYVAVFEKGNNGDPLKYTVAFTMSDECTITLLSSDKYGVYTGNYYDLKTKYAGTPLAAVYDNTILSQPGTFNNWKQHTMSSQVCEYLNHYVLKNNKIARDYGIKYSFTLPESASTDLANGLSSVTFMVLFQGYPYGAGTNNVFNKFCVSGAHVSKAKVYYVRPVRPVPETGGAVHYYYHKRDCKELSDCSNEMYNYGNGLGYACSSAQEAAETGAMPCPYCCR